MPTQVTPLAAHLLELARAITEAAACAYCGSAQRPTVIVAGDAYCSTPRHAGTHPCADLATWPVDPYAPGSAWWEAVGPACIPAREPLPRLLVDRREASPAVEGGAGATETGLGAPGDGSSASPGTAGADRGAEEAAA